MTHFTPILAAGVVAALKQLVTATKLHPILVNFTAALVPVSVAGDTVGRWRKDESLRSTAWWTLACATVLTPFTALSGWLFWMTDDNGVTGMSIHKWLGTGLALLLFISAADLAGAPAVRLRPTRKRTPAIWLAWPGGRARR